MFPKNLFKIILTGFFLIFFFTSLSLAEYKTIHSSQTFSSITPVNLVWDETQQKIILIGNAEDEIGKRFNLFWFFSKNGELVQEKVIDHSTIGLISKGVYLSPGKLILVSTLIANNKKNSLPDILVSTMTTDFEQKIQTIATLKDIDLTFNNTLLLNDTAGEILFLSGTQNLLSIGEKPRNDWQIRIDCLKFTGDKMWTTTIGNQYDNVMGQLIKLGQLFYVIYNSWAQDERWNIKMLGLDNFGRITNEKIILKGPGSDLVNAIEKIDDEHFLLIGTTDSDNNDWGLPKGKSDLIILKYDIDGNIKWSRRLGGQYQDIGITGLYDGQETIWIAGMTESKDGDVLQNHGGWDIWILQLDQDGNILENKCLGTWNDEKPVQLLKVENNIWLLGAFQATVTKTQPLLILINE